MTQHTFQEGDTVEILAGDEGSHFLQVGTRATVFGPGIDDDAVLLRGQLNKAKGAAAFRVPEDELPNEILQEVAVSALKRVEQEQEAA